MLNNSLIKQCLDVLKTEDVRNEIKIMFSPVTDAILYEIYPYIYGTIFLVCLLFILILTILILLILLWQNKKLIEKVIVGTSTSNHIL